MLFAVFEAELSKAGPAWISKVKDVDL